MNVSDKSKKRIGSVRFSVATPSSVIQQSVTSVVRPELYHEDGRGVRHGMFDPLMGPGKDGGDCELCGEPLISCPGHFGHVELVLPVYHAGYYKTMLKVLNAICWQCSRALLTDVQIAKFQMRLRAAGEHSLRRMEVCKAAMDDCKKSKSCPYCFAKRIPIKRVKKASLALYLDKNRKTPKEQRQAAAAVLKGTLLDDEDGINDDDGDDEDNEQLAIDSSFVESLSPMRVRAMLVSMPDADCELFGLDLRNGRPENWVVQVIPVPPMCLRPAVGLDDRLGSQQDDLTMQLVAVVRNNAMLATRIEEGEGASQLMQSWDVLQSAYAGFINVDVCTPEDHSSGYAKRGLVQRLKGKQGRFRQHLSGKRVNFSSRSVVSPDPNLRVNEVGVPVHAALTLTYPETVTIHNIEKLRAAICNGPRQHPGAMRVTRGKEATSTAYGNNAVKAAKLKVGDVVERHICDGDIVLFNRQPSLHRMSIMGHSVRVMQHRTYRLNECACGPYGADFDGDEMNIHVPQTETARAEAALLMGLNFNMLTPKTGEPLVAAIQDFITIAFLLSQKDRFFDRSQVCQIVVSFETHLSVCVELPAPAILKPRRLWTGKQIFGMLLQPAPSLERVGIFIETKNKSYEPPAADDEFLNQCPWMDPADLYVVVCDSEIMCGRMDKKLVGGGSKQTIFYQLLVQHGPSMALSRMSNLAKLCARFVGSLGFSIGIEDVTPSPILAAEKKRLVDAGLAECDTFIAQHASNEITSFELEQKMQQTLSSVRGQAGRACTEGMYPDNAAVVMANCGSKGSAVNISQMAALVGQQILAGQRIPDGFTGRSLPHFEPESRDPAARGFVNNSFFSGLSATEFFFHTMAGREGLIDTSVKTAETGYLQRKMIKVMEDLECHYDGSVRTSAGHIVQFRCGADGLDPLKMEADDDEPMDFELVWRRCQSEHRSKQGSPAARLLAFGADEKRLIEETCMKQEWSRRFAFNVSRFLLNEQEGKSVAARLKRDGAMFFASRPLLLSFLETLSAKYRRALTEPGSPVGAICSQSVGEPATQMTLKTFHFAGIGANITLGVPRLTELVNASPSPSTPVVMAPFDGSRSSSFVHACVDPTTVAHVCRVAVKRGQDGSKIELRLDDERLARLNLPFDLTTTHVARGILAVPRCKIKTDNLRYTDNTVTIVVPQGDSKTSNEFIAAVMTKVVPNAIVVGLSEASKGVTIEKIGATDGLLVQGSVLSKVMAVLGVDALRTYSNNIMEMAKVLGIEAARGALVRELKYVMDQHHISLNERHFKLLADHMTWTGDVQGVNRFGMRRTQTSTLMKASFEQTTDHLFDAAVQGKTDPIRGVSESIIMGQRVGVGTGRFHIIELA